MATKRKNPLSKGSPAESTAAPTLLVSRKEAEQRVAKQIARGKALQADQIRTEADLERANDETRKWVKFSTELLTRIFDRSAYADEFSKSSLDLGFDTSLSAQLESHGRYVKERVARLESVLERLELIPGAAPDEAGEPEASHPPSPRQPDVATHRDRLEIVLTILRRFQSIAKNLANRPRKDKVGFGYKVVDEYDVQDLLCAILKAIVPDLEREDPVSKTAGDSGRVDLSSVALGLVIEIKFVGSAKRAREIAAECRERVMLYARWPELQDLVFFVYDPDNSLPDPDNLISGHTTAITIGEKAFHVRTIVSPWESRAHTATPIPTASPAFTTMRDTSAGEPEDRLAAEFGAAIYLDPDGSVMLPVSFTNRSDKPNSIQAVFLEIAGNQYEATVAPDGPRLTGWKFLLPRDLALGPWASETGALYFGPGFESPYPAIDLPEGAPVTVLVRAVRGPALRAAVEATRRKR